MTTPETPEAHGGLDGVDVAYYEGSQRQCSQDGCTLGRTDAEKAFETLMSGVPDPGVTFPLPANPNPYVTPTQATLDMVMNAIRPPDEHAIKPMADLWRDLSDNHLNNIESDLKNSITTLAGSWKGDDFDGLEENMNTTLTNLGRTREKMNDLAAQLEEAASNLRTHQNLGETPFPPAGFNLVNKESGCCDDYKLHIRPPWTSGDCEIKEGGDEIAEVLCADGSTFAAEERDWIETNAQRLVSEGGYVTEPGDTQTTYGP